MAVHMNPGFSYCGLGTYQKFGLSVCHLLTEWNVVYAEQKTTWEYPRSMFFSASTNF